MKVLTVLVIIAIFIVLLVWVHSMAVTSKRADHKLRQLLRKPVLTVADTPTKYTYKKYLKIFTPSEVFGQASEELAELIQALNKLLRATEKTTPTPYADAYENVVEEIADVSIMLDIITLALEIDQEQLDQVRASKIRRQEKRTDALAERGRLNG